MQTNLYNKIGGKYYYGYLRSSCFFHAHHHHYVLVLFLLLFPPFSSATEAALACLERRWHANTKIAHKPNTIFYNHNTESHFPPLVLNHPVLNHACNSFACKQTVSCWREECNGVCPRFRVFGTEFIQTTTTTTTTTTTNPSIQIGHAFRPPQENFFGS